MILLYTMRSVFVFQHTMFVRPNDLVTSYRNSFSIHHAIDNYIIAPTYMHCPFIDAVQDGLVLPTIVALTGVGRRQQLAAAPKGEDDGNDDAALAIGRAAADCVAVTRRSSVLEDVASRWSKVVVAAVRSSSSSSSSNDDDDDELFHQALEEFSQQTIRRRPNPNVRDDSTMSACYLSSALPGLVDMIAKYGGGGGARSSGRSRTDDDDDDDAGQRAWKGLLSNANVGGENVHRGSVMGAILGARAGFDRLPPQLVDGLYPQEELRKEIDDFVRAVLMTARK
jgi:DNA-directed RNA polymerase subunit K/omega